MQEIVGNVDFIKFDIEVALEEQTGAHPLPFPGMDKSGSAICTYFKWGVCSKGGACPFRHVKGDRSVVCKHWLRGLCKKGDDCEFLHEYDMSKMPECYFFSKFGQCGNKECPFLHIDPEKKMKDCPWYDRGFCRHGPMCKNRHVRRVMCLNYLCGFCLDGPNCKYVHATHDLPMPDPAIAAKKANLTCHYCGASGHKAANCPDIPDNLKTDFAHKPAQREPFAHHNLQRAEPHYDHPPPPRRFFGPNKTFDLEKVTCYKCGEKGHLANRCPKGHLAFLSAHHFENTAPMAHTTPMDTSASPPKKV